MKPITHKTTRTLIGLLTAAMMVACQKNNHPVIGASATSGSAVSTGATAGASGADLTGSGATGSGATGSGSKSQGTSDGGGGNGIKGQIFESYVIDPVKTPAYANYLNPIMENIKSQLKKRSSTPEKEVGLDPLFQMKTWYLAPIEFKPIAKEILGLSFSKDESQQLAMQTAREIWINSHFSGTDSKTGKPALVSEAHARLILHEFVMSLYLFKFMKYAQICSLSNETMHEHDNCDDTNVDEYWPADAPRALNENDYASIRRVTDWLFTYGAKATIKDIWGKLLDNGFDKRMFDYSVVDDSNSQNPRQPNDIIFSGDEFTNIVERTTALNMMPTQCLFTEMKQRIPCHIEFSKASVEFPETIGGNLRITSADGQQLILNFDFMVQQKNQASAFTLEKGQVMYLFGLGSSHILRSPKIGQKYPFVTLLLSRLSTDANDESLVITGIKLTPQVISQIEHKDATTLRCISASPAVKSLSDDQMLASDEKVSPLINRIFDSSWHDEPYCTN